jgi:acyl carrier protein
VSLQEELAQLLAEVTGHPELASLRPDASLFGGEAGLDSLAGARLLRQVHERYGVDVAAEDLNLDALQSLGTLAAFISGHR